MTAAFHARKNQTPEDKEALDKMRAFPAIIGDSIERFRFREASQELMNLARLGNKYLADQEPWKIIKVDPDTCRNHHEYCAANSSNACNSF